MKTSTRNVNETLKGILQSGKPRKQGSHSNRVSKVLQFCMMSAINHGYCVQH